MDEGRTRTLPVSINAVFVEFLRDDYAEKLLKRLKQYGISPRVVELEITEQSLSERGANYVIRALHLLKENGIHISLDDFGTGHSSLTRLSNYPVDCIKIDRSFVERMHTDRSALAIVKAITQIGASVSLDILVEGIENPEQVTTLKDCDCQVLVKASIFIVHNLVSTKPPNCCVAKFIRTHNHAAQIFNQRLSRWSCCSL